MERLTVTPFGRQAVTAGLLASHAAAQAPAAWERYAKWDLFRALCCARTAFGVTDRDLTVLNALLSFLPSDQLEDSAALLVYPSNRVLAERAHGMAESTLRRHLAALVTAGLVLRHDSPNGKRYARRDGQGEVVMAYGFDLRPLLVRAPQIVAAAEQARTEAQALRLQRDRVVLTVRDAVKLLVYGRENGLPGNWDGWDDALRLLQRELRRKLSVDSLSVLLKQAQAILADLRAAVMPADNAEEKPETMPDNTTKMSGKDADSGRHLQNSDKDYLDLEPCAEKPPEAEAPPPIPLSLVVKACPDISDYRPHPIESWSDLIDTASFLRPMMGISADAWDRAVHHMGACTAAITLVCMLQRAPHIKSPGGYLRSLTTRAANGAFSTGPMVMALLNGRSGRRAA